MPKMTKAKPERPMSQREAMASLSRDFEDFVMAGDLQSFADHAGIRLNNLRPENVWDAFLAHYTGPSGIDIPKFATDLATWGPIASRIVELQLEQRARDCA